MLPATVPGAARQVAPAEAARIAAVLQAALSGAYTLRLNTYAEWARARGNCDAAITLYRPGRDCAELPANRVLKGR